MKRTAPENYKVLNEQVRLDVKAVQEELEANGYTCVDHLRVEDHSRFRRLMTMANRRFNTPEIPDVLDHYFDYVPNSDMSAEICRHPSFPAEDCHLYFAYDIQWFPTWIHRILTLEKKWRDSARGPLGRAKPEDHDELVSVLHKGVQGDLDTVDAFFCLHEMATDDTVPSPQVLSV